MVSLVVASSGPVRSAKAELLVVGARSAEKACSKEFQTVGLSKGFGFDSSLSKVAFQARCSVSGDGKFQDWVG